ncbi:MAG: cytochrome d ubiquinol oxidase subunit II [Candidatus Aminicenantes bacterium RBG_13_63_10]|nr:MAG: cytochrome d ubiquinol oxidase subunit II [Candidatus Aminicenantes bacterium RBG_13_63_10]
MEPSALQTLWFFLVGFLLAGYTLLDGYDLGVGCLLPFLAEREEEKRTLIRAIGPFWDGNEVWLLAAGAALFSAFPRACATVFSGFHLALILVLFALIFRTVSLKFHGRDTKRAGLWELTFSLGSWIPALLFGAALGNVIVGVPLDAAGEFRGTFFTLLRLFPTAIGLLGLSTFLLHGTAYISLKAEGPLRDRAKKAAVKLWWTEGLLFVACLALSFGYLPWARRNLAAWAGAAVFVIALIVLNLAIGWGKDKLAFLMTSLMFLSLWGIAGAVQYPVLVRARAASFSLTAANASSSPLTLRVMLIIAAVGMPLVIAAVVFLHRIFKGRVGAGKTEY